MRVLYSTLFFVAATVVLTIVAFFKWQGWLALLTTFSTIHARAGAALVFMLAIFAIVRIIRYQFLLWREEAAINQLSGYFGVAETGYDPKKVDGHFKELVAHKLWLRPSLLKEMLGEEVLRQQTIRRVEASDRFETDDFVNTYHLSLAQHRNRLEDSRVLILSICIAFTVIGLNLMLGNEKIPRSPDEIQAYMTYALGGARVVFVVSALGLPLVALLYVLGAKTREWEQQVVTRLDRLLYASLSPLFNRKQSLSRFPELEPAVAEPCSLRQPQRA